MTQLMENVIKKFVPKIMMKHLHIGRITDVKLNQQASLNMVIMAVRFENPSKGDFSMDKLQIYTALVKRHGGYIDLFRNQGFIACFTHAKDALKTTTAINETARIAKQIATVVLHGAENVSIGVIGDDDRMQVTVTSNHASIAESMLVFARKHDISVLVSGSLVTMVPESKQFRKKYLCFAHYDQQNKWFEWIMHGSPAESFTSKIGSAIEAVYDMSYLEAIPLLQDVVTHTKHGRCTELLKVCNVAMEYLARKVTEIDFNVVLQDEALVHSFEQFLQTEKSEENIYIYKHSMEFNLVPSLEKAKRIKHKFLENENVNLSDQVKQDLITGLSRSLEEATQALQLLCTEVKIVMQDAFQRFKTKPECKIALVKHAKFNLLYIGQ